MPNYTVKSPLQHDGVPFAIDDVVEMDEQQAASLIEAEVLSAALADEDKKPKNKKAKS